MDHPSLLEVDAPGEEADEVVDVEDVVDGVVVDGAVDVAEVDGAVAVVIGAVDVVESEVVTVVNSPEVAIGGLGVTERPPAITDPVLLVETVRLFEEDILIIGNEGLVLPESPITDKCG